MSENQDELDIIVPCYCENGEHSYGGAKHAHLPGNIVKSWEEMANSADELIVRKSEVRTDETPQQTIDRILSGLRTINKVLDYATDSSASRQNQCAWVKGAVMKLIAGGVVEEPARAF